ncbi:MAG: hypothetical protein ACC654_13025 [Acidimicrobiia bacterium]
MTELPRKPKGKRRVLKAARRIVGEHGLAETKVRSARNAAKFAFGKPVSRRNFFAVRTGSRERFGVFGMGGCDMRTIVGAGPRLAEVSDRTLCIGSFAKVDHTRSDLLLQTLDPPDESVTSEVVERLGLIDSYFSPVLFEEDFAVPSQFGLGMFPKDVIVLGISSDVVRTLYRHREHGFLVDPGGWWLTADMGAVLNDLSAVKWFAANFVKVHRIPVDESMANFGRIIEEVRGRTGAFVVVLNVLTVDPGSSFLGYRHANSPNRVRRREFGLAAAELSARQGVPLLDVDRLTKEIGISGQADFVHYTPEQKSHIAREFAELLIDAGVVGSRA